MTYVIIAAEITTPGYAGSTKYTGEPVVISAHRTLKAAQRAWRRTFNRTPPQFDKPYRYCGILTPNGLVNYFGEPILGPVKVRMGVFDG